ncbi:MAG: GlxA family transcriptional regulator [Pseudomonadota bacterium]
MTNEPIPRQFAFLLTPQFALLAFANVVDGLRAANGVLNRTAYRWNAYGLEKQAQKVEASCGLTIDAGPLEEALNADVICVCGGNNSVGLADTGLKGVLREALRRGRTVGALSDASFLLADAGLFDGRRSTIHWRFQHAYRERFADLDIRSSLFEIDGPVFSCAGGASALDLILRMIMADHGARAASLVAENFLHDQMRASDQQNRLSLVFNGAKKNPDLVRAIFLIEANLEAPLSIDELSTRLNIDNRQLGRLFQRYLGVSPSEFYRERRLERAKQLLDQSSMSITEIAASCGFASGSHLSKLFHRRYGATPAQHRRQSS